MVVKCLKSLPGEGIEPSPGVTPRGDFKSPASTVSPPRRACKITYLRANPKEFPIGNPSAEFLRIRLFRSSFTPNFTHSLQRMLETGVGGMSTRRRTTIVRTG